MLELSLPFNPDTAGLVAGKSLIKQGHLGHHGTHLDRVLKSQVPLDYFKNRGVLFDVRRPAQPNLASLADADLSLIQPGDFIIFRTGAIEKYPYATKKYMAEPFDLDWPLIEALLDRDIHFIGIDARGIRRNEEHYQADSTCEKAGVYVIENMCHLEQIPALEAFSVYAAWFDLGGTGIPVRVLADI